MPALLSTLVPDCIQVHAGGHSQTHTFTDCIRVHAAHTGGHSFASRWAMCMEPLPRAESYDPSSPGAPSSSGRDRSEACQYLQGRNACGFPRQTRQWSGIRMPLLSTQLHTSPAGRKACSRSSQHGTLQPAGRRVLHLHFCQILSGPHSPLRLKPHFSLLLPVPPLS